MFEFRWAMANLKGSRLKYSTAMVLNVVLAVFLLLWPIMTRKVVALITDASVSGIAVDAAELLKLLGIWLGLVLVRNLISIFYVWLKESATQEFICRIRVKIFANLAAQEGEFFDRLKAGDILNRLTGDIDVVGWNIRYVGLALINTIVLFGVSVAYFFTINWKLTVCLLAVLPFMYITSSRFSKEMRPHYVANREKMSALNEVTQENIAANKTVRAFAREDYENKKFYEVNKNYLDEVLQTNKVWLSIWPIPETLAQFMTVIVLVVGGLLVMRSEMTMADLTAFTSLVWALAATVRNIGNLLNEFQRFFPSADKAIELYYAQPRIISRSDCRHIEGRLKGDISFENVSFSIHDHPIINDISFSVPAGKTVAVVGETGSGKTTLVNLLARFYDPTEGCVKVDGVDLREYDLQELRGSIGMAMQDVFLFSDSIDGNIAFGAPDMTEENVKESAVRADADDFIKETESGYDTIIDERGMGLSGGQRQRIALARALAIKPPILVLDDTTSAVDMKTERYIWDQLQHLPFSCTKIIIAQRITTVCAADQILVVQGGRITQRGTHRELIKQEGFYKDIYTLQSQQTE